MRWYCFPLLHHVTAERGQLLQKPEPCGVVAHMLCLSFFYRKKVETTASVKPTWLNGEVRKGTKERKNVYIFMYWLEKSYIWALVIRGRKNKSGKRNEETIKDGINYESFYFFHWGLDILLLPIVIASPDEMWFTFQCDRNWEKWDETMRKFPACIFYIWKWKIGFSLFKHRNLLCNLKSWPYGSIIFWILIYSIFY